jgi:hypothetical protein
MNISLEALQKLMGERTETDDYKTLGGIEGYI